MPDFGDAIALPERNESVLSFLQNRRSNLAKLMSDPGPDADEILTLLEIAGRVPDHRKLAPWRFITFTGTARSDFGQHIGAAFAKDNPDVPLDRTMFEAQRLMRAPVVIAVISSPVDCPRGTPEWEQVLSSGVACYNLLIAAQASGWAAQWLTEWYAYHPDIQKRLELGDCEKVAGFIYIGSAEAGPTERARPDVKALTQSWPHVPSDDDA